MAELRRPRQTPPAASDPDETNRWCRTTTNWPNWPVRLAHEIKNPLAVIRMNMDLLAEDLADAETPRERRARTKIDVVHDQCTRLENLLNDFLQVCPRPVARPACRAVSTSRSNRCCGSLTFRRANRKIRILPHLDRELPSVLLDKETLRAALLNLVKNAIEAMPDGGAPDGDHADHSNGVALDLIDTGAGMDETTALHMFEAFYSTKDGGSGLGLPTARKIIEAHGGRISVQSDVGRGTKFTLEFPTPRRI